ncbi:DUF3931 domain-containing protein (plasmid) [Pontibacillus sp. ALD_SL1]|uniref:DUF3931 domain-containing protein n=1 Tax=Pontibacillus sp. ALD_SL1 TaxID=2777185 RepID=UPI001A96B5FB|nr:DUF3931 domain-containing protein [Pontibacillus sp. ALD_SL1]QST02919.1 DUF3931 domain-containing protein [Pontibacillus sp. ALD_SL1]
MGKENNIIALEGGKKKLELSQDTDNASLTIDGETFELDSFVLSGQNKDGKRVIFSWQVSLDEMVVYAKALEVVVNERMKEALGE